MEKGVMDLGKADIEKLHIQYCTYISQHTTHTSTTINIVVVVVVIIIIP